MISPRMVIEISLNSSSDPSDARWRGLETGRVSYLGLEMPVSTEATGAGLLLGSDMDNGSGDSTSTAIVGASGRRAKLTKIGPL